MKRWQPWFLIFAASLSYAIAAAPNRLQERTAEQSPLDLALIYGIHRWGVMIAVVLLLTGLWAYAGFWRRQRAESAATTGAPTPARPRAAQIVGRLLLAAPLVVTAIGTYWVYEAERTPLWPEMSDPRYLTIAEADFLTDADMVHASFAKK